MSDQRRCVSISDCTTPNFCLSVGTCKSVHVMPASVRASVSDIERFHCWKCGVRNIVRGEAPASAPLPLTDGWHPIATAPKDDTVFLAYRNGQVRETRVLVRSDGELWSFGGIQWFPSVFPDRPLPTHWRPMLAAPGECLAAAPVADERPSPELNEILEFLYGAAPLDGVWFGDKPEGKPRYWWRSKLRAALSGGSPEPVSGSEEGGRVE